MTKQLNLAIILSMVLIFALGGCRLVDPLVAQGVTNLDQLVLDGVAAADAGVTTETLEVAISSPVDTTGTNIHDAVTIDIAVGNSTGGTNSVVGLQVDAITDDAQVVTTAIQVGDEWNYALDVSAPVVSTASTWYDDFLGDTAPAELFEISGSDAQAVQALVSEQYGVYQLTSSDAGTGCAADCEAFNIGLEWQADQGSLVFETRLHLDGDILTAGICAGFSDDESTVEMPFGISGTTITSTVADGVMFCFDTDATTDEWYFLGVDTGTDATGNAITGTAPVVDVYQVLRIEVDSAGAVCRGYIDGTLAITLTANCVTNTVALAPGVWVDSASNAASHVFDVDYLYVSADRD